MSTSIVQVGSADKLGRFNIMIVTSVVCYAVLFGCWNGAAISLTPVCLSQVCRTEDYGKRAGTISSLGTLTGFLSGSFIWLLRWHLLLLGLCCGWSFRRVFS